MEHDDEDRDGTSPETAIVVSSVAEEYAWLQKHQPAFQLEMQALSEFEGRPYDVLHCRNGEGELRTFYFDISQFFGKRRRDGRRLR